MRTAAGDRFGDATAEYLRSLPEHYDGVIDGDRMFIAGDAYEIRERA